MELMFEIREGEGESILLFGHRNWKEPVEFMAHCGCKSAHFMLSLKSLVEKGKGHPYPEDESISSWGMIRRQRRLMLRFSQLTKCRVAGIDAQS
jgi:hypothetical protein